MTLVDSNLDGRSTLRGSDLVPGALKAKSKEAKLGDLTYPSVGIRFRNNCSSTTRYYIRSI